MCYLVVYVSKLTIISEVTTIKEKLKSPLQGTCRSLELAALFHSCGQMSDFLRVVGCLQTKQECWSVTLSEDLTDTHCFLQLVVLKATIDLQYYIFLKPWSFLVLVTLPDSCGWSRLPFTDCNPAQKPSKPAFSPNFHLSYLHLDSVTCHRKPTQDRITVR